MRIISAHIQSSVLILSVFLSACNSNIEKEDVRPNIVFILVDDQTSGMLSCEGHSIVQTPAIDKLAEDGVRFTNAFVTTSICAASRASLLTGLYESVHSYTFGKDPIISTYVESSYPYLLKKSGYSTGFIGKLGVRLENQDSSLLGMFDYCWLSPRSTPYLETLDDGSIKHSAEIKGEKAIEFIGNQSKGKPFCLSISFNAVHAVDGNLEPGNDGHYPYPESVAALYEDIEMPAPELSDPKIYENHPEFLKKSMNRERYFWRWDTEEKYQINLRAYFRMISGYDMVVGSIMEALEEKGFDENTIIIYSSDNGYYMGNRGFAGKWSHYEESLRVPLIIYDPRNSEEDAGRIKDNMALNIDIPATILDIAGIDQPVHYNGLSLNPLLVSQYSKSWRDNFFIEHRMDNELIPKYTGLRGERYVYARYYEQDPPYEFLHDLKEDPKQLENLADDKDYKDILDALSIECDIVENKLTNQK